MLSHPAPEPRQDEPGVMSCVSVARAHHQFSSWARTYSPPPPLLHCRQPASPPSAVVVPPAPVHSWRRRASPLGCSATLALLRAAGCGPLINRQSTTDRITIMPPAACCTVEAIILVQFARSRREMDDHGYRDHGHGHGRHGV